MTYPIAAVNESYTLLPTKLESYWARVFQAAAGYQETKYLTRFQYGGGPARGYWQFEEGGAVKGVMEFKADGGKIAALARQVCHARGVPFVRHTVWEALAKDDVLAAAFARLLMYTDPYALPTTQDAAWTAYAKRLWRPGKPHPDEWPESWAFALRVVAK